MNTLIGVIGGTPIDSSMGVEFLAKKGYRSIALPISKNAKEQSRMQILSKEELYGQVLKVAEEGKNRGVNSLFVYCNSLSAAVDMDKIEEEAKIKVVTPFVAYEKIGERSKSLLVLAANGQSCAKIESLLEASNKNLEIWSMSALPLVEKIEENIGAKKVFDDLNIEYILRWAESNRVENIVLACTHFPYLKDILEKTTSINIIDPGEIMLESLFA